ncbi:unnamed protein product, partial [Prunus brigantina]
MVVKVEQPLQRSTKEYPKMTKMSRCETVNRLRIVPCMTRPSLFSDGKSLHFCFRVTVQTETEQQIDELGGKEEKRQRRGTEYDTDSELAAVNFFSLIQASEGKSHVDDLLALGEGIAYYLNIIFLRLDPNQPATGERQDESTPPTSGDLLTNATGKPSIKSSELASDFCPIPHLQRTFFQT